LFLKEIHLCNHLSTCLPLALLVLERPGAKWAQRAYTYSHLFSKTQTIMKLWSEQEYWKCFFFFLEDDSLKTTSIIYHLMLTAHLKLKWKFIYIFEKYKPVGTRICSLHCSAEKRAVLWLKILIDGVKYPKEVMPYSNRRKFYMQNSSCSVMLPV